MLPAPAARGVRHEAAQRAAGLVKDGDHLGKQVLRVLLISVRLGGGGGFEHLFLLIILTTNGGWYVLRARCFVYVFQFIEDPLALGVACLRFNDPRAHVRLADTGTQDGARNMNRWRCKKYIYGRER